MGTDGHGTSNIFSDDISLYMCSKVLFKMHTIGSHDSVYIVA